MLELRSLAREAVFIVSFVQVRVMQDPNLCGNVVVEMARIRRVTKLWSVGGGISMDVVPIDATEPLVTLRKRVSDKSIRTHRELP